MCRKECGRGKKPPTLMKIQRANGASGTRPSTNAVEQSGAVERLERFKSTLRSSAAARKNCGQLFWWNDFELLICAVTRLLVRAPPAKLRRVTEAVALHVVVSDFDYEFGT